MKNKCLFVLLLALGCCHVQAQKSQKNPLPEALVQLNQKVDSELIPGIKRSPLIGISTDISPKRTAVNTAYVQSVILSGGIPYMIPVTDNVEILRQIVSQLDGIVFTGGEDIQPIYYDFRRRRQVRQTQIIERRVAGAEAQHQKNDHRGGEHHRDQQQKAA